MKPVRSRLLWILTALVAAALACNLPGQAPQGPAVFTPDLTLTAIYSVLNTPVSGQPAASPTSPAFPPTAGALESPAVAPPTSAPPTSAPATVPPSPTLPLPPTATSAPPTATSVPPTATTAPTSTPVSYVGPSVRAGAKFVAFYMQREPTIDGVFDEWNQDRYSAASVVFGGNRWSGQDDLSSTVMFAWDDYFLYIAARVKDDTYVQRASGANIFLGDSIEILLDALVSKDYYLDELSGDDFQLGISPGRNAPGSSPEAYLWYPKKLAGDQPKVKTGAMAVDLGYRIEVKIPWELFGIDPDIGQHYGFAYSVSDNDRSGENVQQSMVSVVSTRNLADPTTWGDLELRGKP